MRQHEQKQITQVLKEWLWRETLLLPFSEEPKKRTAKQDREYTAAARKLLKEMQEAGFELRGR